MNGGVTVYDMERRKADRAQLVAIRAAAAPLREWLEKTQPPKSFVLLAELLDAIGKPEEPNA